MPNCAALKKNYLVTRDLLTKYIKEDIKWSHKSYATYMQITKIWEKQNFKGYFALSGLLPWNDQPFLKHCEDIINIKTKLTDPLIESYFNSFWAVRQSQVLQIGTSGCSTNLSCRENLYTKINKYAKEYFKWRVYYFSSVPVQYKYNATKKEYMDAGCTPNLR